jgi:hypothetical protein
VRKIPCYAAFHNAELILRDNVPNRPDGAIWTAAAASTAAISNLFMIVRSFRRACLRAEEFSLGQRRGCVDTPASPAERLRG